MITTAFAGRHALFQHRADHHRAALEAQLRRIGLHVRSVAPAAILPADTTDADVIFFDADCGDDGMFPWSGCLAPVPMIALTGSEAPGRLEWALRQSATAFMTKPIGAAGAFQALVVATQLHARLAELSHSVSDLSDRVRARPLVVRAIMEVMRRHDLDESRALDRLRRAAMASQQSLEELAATIAATPCLAADLTDTPSLSMVRPRRRPSRHS